MALRKTDPAKAIVEAHTDLNIFAAIVAILEGGTVSADAQPDDFKVIALCQQAQKRALRRFDIARAALSSQQQPSNPTPESR